MKRVGVLGGLGGVWRDFDNVGRRGDNPSVNAARCHLPLHKGGVCHGAAVASGRCTPRVLVPLRSTAWASPPTKSPAARVYIFRADRVVRPYAPPIPPRQKRTAPRRFFFAVSYSSSEGTSSSGTSSASTSGSGCSVTGAYTASAGCSGWVSASTSGTSSSASLR